MGVKSCLVGGIHRKLKYRQKPLATPEGKEEAGIWFESQVERAELRAELLQLQGRQAKPVCLSAHKSTQELTRDPMGLILA